MKRIKGRPKLSQEQALRKLRAACGKRYEVIDFTYDGPNSICFLRCSTHGIFRKSFRSFVYGVNECQKCNHIEGGKKRIGNKHTLLPESEAMDRLKAAHGDTCSYDDFKYVNCETPGKIVCSEHGEFWQSLASHVKSVYGCPKCESEHMNARQALKWDDVVSRARAVHGNRYQYPDQDYKNVVTPIKIVCQKHGEFWQAFGVHVYYKSNCPECANYFKHTLEEFAELGGKVHHQRYDYSRVVYKNGRTKVEIICPEHGSFWQRPENHLNQKNGCPRCASHGPSKMEREWLSRVGVPDDVEHRQVRIPDTTWIADGKIENTFFEFLGTYWHGDPRKYSPEDVNLRNGRRMGILYLETIERQQRIRNLGHELKFVWEIDYRDGILLSDVNPHEL